VPPPLPKPPPAGTVVVVAGTVVVGTVVVGEPVAPRLFGVGAMLVGGVLAPLTPGGAPSASVDGEAPATVDVVVAPAAAVLPWWWPWWPPWPPPVPGAEQADSAASAPRPTAVPKTPFDPRPADPRITDPPMPGSPHSPGPSTH
jgi:hypothetical protein